MTPQGRVGARPSFTDELRTERGRNLSEIVQPVQGRAERLGMSLNHLTVPRVGMTPLCPGLDPVHFAESGSRVIGLAQGSASYGVWARSSDSLFL